MMWADLASHFIIFLGGDRPHSSTNVQACRRMPICPLFLGFFEPKRKGAAISPPRSTAARLFEQYGLLPIPVFTTSRSPLLLGISLVGWGCGFVQKAENDLASSDSVGESCLT